MHVFFPMPKLRKATASCAGAVHEHSTRRAAIRQFFQPKVLAFLGLALAVGGWAYGNKLSHYYHLFGVGKASSARIWVDHRDDVSQKQVQQGDDAQRVLAALVLAASEPKVPQFTARFIATAPEPSSPLR